MQARSRIAVAGATGRVGRHVVDVLEAAGHDVVPMSRSGGVDVITGVGLAEALAGVECIVDTATGPSPDQHAATEFFTTAAPNLHDAASPPAYAGWSWCRSSGPTHSPRATTSPRSPTSGACSRARSRYASCARPSSRVRRAARGLGQAGRLSYVPKMRTQLVAARTVAQALAELATRPEPESSGAPITEIAGPREERLVDMATLLVRRRGDPVRIEGVSDPDDPDRELFETDGLLPGPDATLAGPTFEEWLDSAS